MLNNRRTWARACSFTGYGWRHARVGRGGGVGDEADDAGVARWRNGNRCERVNALGERSRSAPRSNQTVAAVGAQTCPFDKLRVPSPVEGLGPHVLLNVR